MSVPLISVSTGRAGNAARSLDVPKQQDMECLRSRGRRTPELLGWVSEAVCYLIGGSEYHMTGVSLVIHPERKG